MDAAQTSDERGPPRKIPPLPAQAPPPILETRETHGNLDKVSALDTPQQDAQLSSSYITKDTSNRLGMWSRNHRFEWTTRSILKATASVPTDTDHLAEERDVVLAAPALTSNEPKCSVKKAKVVRFRGRLLYIGRQKNAKGNWRADAGAETRAVHPPGSGRAAYAGLSPEGVCTRLCTDSVKAGH